ncbi:unnamed protein product [Rotaria sordida]|uniref:Uncharacterized protein n=1 Tax=Rotaria sordida TaxID=392033 RepID=A0A813XSX3_9BILA|nr:unnamed protein product [Rotaria sordida]
MFLDDKSIKYKKVNNHIDLLSSTLKGNVIKQAASKLLQHVTLNKNFYYLTQNINGNAFDDYHTSSNYIQQNKKEFQRTDKCNSWLSKFPTKSDTSLNQLPIFIKSSLYKHQSRDYLSPIDIYPQTKYSNISMNQSHYMPLQFHSNPIILSSNAIPNDINPQYEPFSQPLMVIHKKRLRRDYFLSTMQNCIQPPYSQNHFYAFDQINMLKLQRNLHTNNYEKDNNQPHHLRNYDSDLKRKYFEIYNDDKSQCHCSDIQYDQISLSKKQHLSSPIEQSSSKIIDHININKYHDELKNSFIFNEKFEKDLTKENQTLEQSNIIISHLEKILNLCGELRTLAKDVENHLNDKTISSNMINNKNPIDIPESDQTTTVTIDIQQTINDINEKNASPPYQLTNDTLSIHSESNKSHPFMQTESFKTKSPSLTTSHTTLRRSEDICSCFLKSFFDKQNCDLNIDEQEYLNELTKAYLLGKQQILKEQQEENNKFQILKNETLPGKQQESNDLSSLVFDTNNNNQSITPPSPSSILFYNNFQKLDNPLSSIPNNSTISLVENDQQQQLSTPSGMISSKHEIFINEPIAMKTTNVLPGIGIKYAQQLAEYGFTTVRRLLGFYLMIKDDQHFVIWLNNKVGISIHSAWLCTNALRAWCEQEKIIFTAVISFFFSYLRDVFDDAIRALEKENFLVATNHTIRIVTFEIIHRSEEEASLLDLSQRIEQAQTPDELRELIQHIYSLIDETKESIKQAEGKNIQALDDTLKQFQSYLETILDRVDKILDENLSNLNDDDDDDDGFLFFRAFLCVNEVMYLFNLMKKNQIKIFGL